MITPRIALAKTIPQLFQYQIEESGAKTAYEYEDDGDWKSVTWDEYGEQVRLFSMGLKSMGVEPGTRVAIWGNTSHQWTIADLGIMALGGSSVGIYQTCTSEQAGYIISNSDSRIVICDNRDRLEQAMSMRETTPQVEFYVVWKDAGDLPDQVFAYDTILEMGNAYCEEHSDAYQTSVDGVEPDTTATVIYTSGTTGPAKGAMLSHRNCIFCSEAAYDRMTNIHDDSAVAFLPLSHVAEHVVGLIGRIYAGTTAYFLEDMHRFPEVVRLKKPTLIGGVPRLFEKAHTSIMSRVDASSPGKQKLFAWAVQVGADTAAHTLMNRPVPIFLRLKHVVADRLVLAKVRGALGGRVRTVICGAAPIAMEITQFFNAIGIQFFEVYGMTESSGISHMNSVGQFKLDTVGTVVKGFDCEIAGDGEILVRGDGVFQGYLNDPEATAEAVDAEGWLHTGDIGEIDDEGFLRITDRKKNLLVTAGGKNIAPANIEMLITREPLISQVVVIGDRRNFLSALITVSAEAIAALRATEEFSSHSHEEMVESDHVKRIVDASVEKANGELARYENIRKYTILAQEFSIEGDELTPTMKIKRAVVIENYGSTIEEFYSEGSA